MTKLTTSEKQKLATTLGFAAVGVLMLVQFGCHCALQDHCDRREELLIEVLIHCYDADSRIAQLEKRLPATPKPSPREVAVREQYWRQLAKKEIAENDGHLTQKGTP